MITAIYKASLQVPPLDVSNGEMLILARGGTVKDDEGNSAFGLFVTCHRILLMEENYNYNYNYNENERDYGHKNKMTKVSYADVGRRPCFRFGFRFS